MDYGRLGNTGLTVSHLPGMHELGIRPFDTASAYSFGASEEITGRALRELSRREDVVIATKVFNPMRPGPNGRGCRARRSSTRSTRA